MGESRTRLNLAVIGAALSANKGAASMVLGLVDGLSDRGIHAEVSLLTTYRTEDEEVLGTHDESLIPDGITVRVVNAAPFALMLALVLSLPIRLLDRLRLPLGPLLMNPLIRAVRRSDVTVDLAGIAFADGRGFALLGYNVVMSMFPFLAGGSVVKASQALGPFTNKLTRTAARIVLPRMTTICARGASTRSHLDLLGLSNVVDATDIAFLMRHTTISDDASTDLGDTETGHAPAVVVFPSAVVDAYAVAAGVDHVDVVASMIDALSASGARVIVAPHSFRQSGERGRMNDGPIVEDIEQRVNEPAEFVNRDLDPRELRAIIERADVAVTGRFHGMVSALKVGTPPVVIGWSHKYGEVLDQFNVSEQGISVNDLSTDRLLAIVKRTLDDREAIARTIGDAYDAVCTSAGRNIEVIVEAASKRRDQ
jgi:polysaccharide pyruvyl transferase WcaK-like protein